MKNFIAIDAMGVPLVDEMLDEQDATMNAFAYALATGKDSGVIEVDMNGFAGIRDQDGFETLELTVTDGVPPSLVGLILATLSDAGRMQ